MILRRLSQSLKEQSWTTILIEFVLLVGGLALSVIGNYNPLVRDMLAREKPQAAL